MAQCNTVKMTRPLMSLDFQSARRQALGLYRAIYRSIPYLVRWYDVTKNEYECRCKLRELFYKNRCITDVRVIDLLVLKGYMDLKELTETWSSKHNFLAYWEPTVERKPTDFVSKFINGVD